MATQTIYLDSTADDGSWYSTAFSPYTITVGSPSDRRGFAGFDLPSLDLRFGFSATLSLTVYGDQTWADQDLTVHLLNADSPPANNGEAVALEWGDVLDTQIVTDEGGSVVTFDVGAAIESLAVGGAFDGRYMLFGVRSLLLSGTRVRLHDYFADPTATTLVITTNDPPITLMPR